MKLLAAVVALIPLFACSGNGDEPPDGGHVNLSIHTVNEQGQAFPAEAVRWWYADQRETRHTLSCKATQCAEWQLDAAVGGGAVVVQASTSVVKKTDDQCWDLYAGEVVVEMPAVDATIVMAYTNTACR